MRKIEVDNHVITDPKLIQQNQKLFYEQLYNSRQELSYSRYPLTKLKNLWNKKKSYVIIQ